MNQRDFAKILKKAEKQVPVGVRVQDRLLHLRFHIEAIPGDSRDEWLEIRKLARHGKRIATRFHDDRMKKFFGVFFNTASTYLGLPGDGDQRAEAYALT